MSNRIYSGKSACDKCGDQHAMAKWGYFMGRDWIRRTCRNCEYSWYENPLDHTEAVKVGSPE